MSSKYSGWMGLGHSDGSNETFVIPFKMDF